ncbi:9633_t:CDS:2, partial [Paraglomus brasilianum]
MLPNTSTAVSRLRGYLRKGLAHKSTEKDNQDYEVDDGERIMELEIPKNCRKVFEDQLTSFKKKWVADEELLELSAC